MNPQPQINSLNKHQLEILKLFKRNMEDNDLLEIKRLIVRYLADKATKLADKVWDENDWSNEDMDRLLNTHQRTKYNPKNG